MAQCYLSRLGHRVAVFPPLPGTARLAVPAISDEDKDEAHQEDAPNIILFVYLLLNHGPRFTA